MILISQVSPPIMIRSITETIIRVHHMGLNHMRVFILGLQNHIPAKMVKIHSRAQKITARMKASSSSSSSAQFATETIEPILINT